MKPSDKSEQMFKPIYEMIEAVKKDSPEKGELLSDILDSAFTGGEWMGPFKYLLPQIKKQDVTDSTWEKIQLVLSGFYKGN